MLDDFDLSNGTEGTPWLRRITGIVGMLIGAGLGYMYHLIEASTGLVAIGHVVVPTLFGAGLGWLFSGYILFGFVLVVVFAVAFGWQWLTGGS